MKNILLIEDEENLNRGISLKLKKEGYAVFSAACVSEGLKLFQDNTIDLVICDIGLPDGSGLDLCANIRQRSDVLFLFLTALDTEVDVITGYEMGADDYVTKPFSMSVLVSKISAMLKRTEKAVSNIVQTGKLTFYIDEKRVVKGDNAISITPTDWKLLMAFIEHPHHILSRKQLLERLWDSNTDYVDENAVAVAPTESIQNYLKPFHIDTPISIAPTGLPPACFENHIEATAIRKKYLQKKQYLFCTVSRLAKEKNLSFLLRGVSAVKKQLGDVFNVLILGDGPEKENLIALSQTLKIEENVFFIGEVSNHKISAYHQACDLFLFSSKSETQGIVLLEAMAAYLPVFAIRATGVSDVVVNGENGVLSSDSITEWADNLISILKNPAVLIKMRSSARTTALLYDEKSIANQILESYAYLKKSYEAEHWLMMHLNRTSYPVLAKEY